MNENVAVVLGAGPGLGFSLAKRWAQEGYTVVIMARDHARITQAAHQLTERGLKAYAQVIDCADNDSIRTALAKVQDEVGPIDTLLYNTAVLRDGLASAIDPAELCRRYQVDVAGAVAAVQAVLPGMRAAGRGTILFTGGGLALNPLSQFTSISIHKAALRAYAQALHDEVASDGVYAGIVNVLGNIGSSDHYAPAAIAYAFFELASTQGSFELTY